MYTIIYIEMGIVCLKNNTDGTVSLTRYEIEVCIFGEFINFKSTPNRIHQLNHRFSCQKCYRLL